MRLFNGLGCSVPLLNTSHVIPKSDVELTVIGTLELHDTVGGLGASSRDLPAARGPLKMPRRARWHEPRLDCASHLDVISLAANTFAPFGAAPRISRTARRITHDLLCAALLLLGYLRPARAARLAIAALGVCHASYPDLLLDAAFSFSSTAARACLSSQHTARERTWPIPSRARGLLMLIVGHNNRLRRPRCWVLSFV